MILQLSDLDLEHSKEDLIKLLAFDIVDIDYNSEYLILFYGFGTEFPAGRDKDIAPIYNTLPKFARW